MADGAYDPAQLAQAATQLEARLLRAATDWAKQGQTLMRANAPWTDRGGKDSPTGLDARNSLFAEAGTDAEGNILIVFRGERVSSRLWHGEPAPIAAFLELKTRKMHRKYDIIKRTMEDTVPDLRSRLQAELTP